MISSLPDLKPRTLESKRLTPVKDSNRGRISGRTSPIPNSIIPEKYHIVEKSVAPPQDDTLGSEYIEKEKLWATKVFPSTKPTGRKEVLLLENWLNKMLQENIAKVVDPLEAVKEAQKLYNICFHELSRQVWVQCAERGQLMEKLWNRYLQLFEHVLRMRENEREQYNKKIVEHQHTYQQLYKDKDERFNKMYLQLAAEKERVSMQKDKLERAILVLREEFKKRIQREQIMKKYIQKLRRQQITSNGNSTEEEEENNDEAASAQETLLLASDLNMEAFSDSNLVLINKLEFIETNLLDIAKRIKAGNWDTNYASVIQLENLVGIIKETAKKLGKEGEPAEAADAHNSARATEIEREDKSLETNQLDLRRNIPPSFWKFFSIPDTVEEPTTISKDWVLKCINFIYIEKIFAEQDPSQSPTQTISLIDDFVYEQFTAVFGDKRSIESAMLNFLTSIGKFYQNNKVSLFAQFCGAITDGYTLDELNLYLNLLAQCLARSDSPTSEIVWSITVPNAVAIVQKTIEMTSNFEELVKKVTSLGDNGRVDIEKFLEILVSWEHAKVAIKEEEILQAFAFDSFDDRTYVVTFDELQTTIKRVNPNSQATDRQIMRVYREMTEHSDSIGVNSAKIINTLHKYGLLQWRTLPTPPTLDPSLRAQVVFDYLAEVWNLEEEEVTAALMSDEIPPKIQQQLTEAMETFRKFLDSRNEPDEAIKAHRSCIKQLYFALSQTKSLKNYI